MGVNLFGLKPRQISDLVAVCRSFVAGYAAFLRLDKDTRSDVEELISAATQDDMESHEREGIFGTLALTLFPDLCRALDDVNPGEFCETVNQEAESANRELDQEEATFAQRLQSRMSAMGLTQATLAAAIGVRQSAISMMLSRTCRPQKRTVEKIAAALAVAPNSLWPGFQVEPISPKPYRVSIPASFTHLDLTDAWSQPYHHADQNVSDDLVNSAQSSVCEGRWPELAGAA